MSADKQCQNLEARLNRAVASVISLPPTEWVPAAKVLQAKVSRTRKGIRNLEGKLSAAAEAKVAEGRRIARILRRGPDYGPGRAFVTFRTRRIARLFQAKPEMLDYVKTQAQSASYNVGYKTKIKMYETIAKDPGKILALAEEVCKKDEARGILMKQTGFTLRETLDAMDWYADNMHGQVCSVYEEYKDVPTKEMFEHEKARSKGRSEDKRIEA